MIFYKLVDRPSEVDRIGLGFEIEDQPWVNPIWNGKKGLVAIKTGEKRPPKEGEWYLSGAIPEAYKARIGLGKERL